MVMKVSRLEGVKQEKKKKKKKRLGKAPPKMGVGMKTSEAPSRNKTNVVVSGTQKGGGAKKALPASATENRLLIEFCCSHDSLLGKPTPSNEGCRILRLTEDLDMTTAEGLEFAKRQIDQWLLALVGLTGAQASTVHGAGARASTG